MEVLSCVCDTKKKKRGDIKESSNKIKRSQNMLLFYGCAVSSLQI